ncbi:MAG TPA: ABC transporter substrate-binding protein [Vicinamibacterales bacterium]|nr:ABC transporter substrate-binding protein [Vicinamibacterales bacterium]
MNRHSRALLTILIVAAILVPYWLLNRERTPPPSALLAADAPIPARGGSAVASTRTDPRSFNRLVHSQIATEITTLLTQAKLVRIDRVTRQVEPWLAERWEASPDNLTFTLFLRDGLRWSDGTPFTSADVVFTFSALYDPRTQSPMASALRPGGEPLTVTAPDPRTVVVTFPSLFAPGIRILDNLPMFPRHKLQAALDAGEFGTAWMADTPPSELLSLGPFILTQYIPAQRMVFERNPLYWRKDERGVQLPYLDRLTLELVPDQDAEVVRLQSGQIDFMQQALRASDLATLRPLEFQGRVQVEELGVSPEADAFVFNLRPGKWAGDPRGAWLNRKEFRQALSHAIDREAFSDSVFLGTAVPIHGPITPGNPDWFWASVPRYEFSREKAKALLEGLGLTNRDQDEWLEDERGNEARFTALVFRGNAVLERSATVIREDLRQIGVAMDIVPLEPNSIGRRVIGGDFEAAFVQFTGNHGDPANAKDFWLSNGSAHLWHAGQKAPATDWERQIDELIERQSSTLDMDERKRLFNEVQRLFAENLPILYFAAPRVYIAASARLINLYPALTRPEILWSADTLAVRDGGTSR